MKFPNRRRAIALALNSALALAAPKVLAAPAAQPRRILMLTYRGETDVERGFREQIAAAAMPAEYLTLDVGQDVTRLPGLLASAATFRPELVYTWGTSLTLAVAGRQDAPLKHPAIADVPHVFALVAAPVAAGLVSRLDGHGRNLTGAVHVVPAVVQLRAMHAYRPFDRLGVLYTESEANSRAIVAEATQHCRQTGVKLIARTFKSVDGKPTADGIETLVSQIRDEGAQWLYLLPDTFLGSQYARVTPAALAGRLPTFGAAELAVRSGGALVGLVSRYRSVGQLAGMKAVQILAQGKAASSLPIETLKRFSLIVNLAVARELGGVYPPLEMLNHAELINGTQSKSA